MHTTNTVHARLYYYGTKQPKYKVNYIQHYILPTQNNMTANPTHDIDCVFDGLDKFGAINISNYTSAALKQIRTKLNIKAVVSIASSGYLEGHQELIDYLYIPAQDSDAYQIHKHFQQTFLFIDKHRKSGNVLVHCMVGKSRSATVVAAYLLKKYKYSLSTVMTLLRRKRNKIDPNPGFMKQLEQYCEEIGVPKGEDSRCKSGNKTPFYEKQIITRISMNKYEGKKSDSTFQPDNDSQKQKDGLQQKIQKIREKLITAGKMKTKVINKKMYSDLQIYQLSGSTHLPSNQSQMVWKQNKSLQLN